MIFTREELKSEYCDLGEFIKKHSALIRELYQKAMMLSLDEDETGAESHGILCAIVAVCLLSNEEEPRFPLSYEDEDMKLLGDIAEAVDLVMFVENAVNSGLLKRHELDENGEERFSFTDKGARIQAERMVKTNAKKNPKNRKKKS